MKFIRDLLVAGGKQLAYKGVLERMPQTTREIMEPKEYLAGHRVPPLLLPDLSFLKKDYEPYDAGAVGQLDVSLLLRIYADEKVDKHLSPEWRGGAYYAAGRTWSKTARPQLFRAHRLVLCFQVGHGSRSAGVCQDICSTLCPSAMPRCGALLTNRRCRGPCSIHQRRRANLHPADRQCCGGGGKL